MTIETFCKEICKGDFIGKESMLNTLTEYEQKIRADAIEEFAHNLKETFNNEFPSNYHCTQPYFTLDNVRVLVAVVAKELKGQNKC